MIRFKEVAWSNVFSYGANNVICLDGYPLTQLVGKNGHGKSSIALILEEGLFNTNSKKIKRSDILNRHLSVKTYSISVKFEKDGVPYEVLTTRSGSSTGTLKLLKNGVDISNHTATGTYKQIEHILGFDHKTFSQIVYQSSVSSLEFLTATDTARKKFLIELLNLSKYTEISEVFKGLANGLSKQIDTLSGQISSTRKWLDKYEKEDLKERELVAVPEQPTKVLETITILEAELSNIAITNKNISKNNTYKNILDTLDITTVISKPNSSNLMSMRVEIDALNKELANGNALSSKPSTLIIKCPTCSQAMDNSVMYNRANAFKIRKPDILSRLDDLTKQCVSIDKQTAAWEEYTRKVQEWEKYHALFDPSMQTVLLDKDDISDKIKSLRAAADRVLVEIDKANKTNLNISTHNSKVKVITAQLKEMKTELDIHTSDLTIKLAELSNLQILVKAFSTTGLVAYKIECLVKDLEVLTNEYLATMAGGRFQLSFVIVSDKLNVIITDNGRDIDISALSSGERARVNISTLLAIRKLMQALSNSRTNLLILDETVEALDVEGKEKLIEVLLEEDNLNTFLISHGFSHPLLEKISVVKENNVSRLE